ncbi:MAG: HAD family hydrolase [Deltaproteobacteria bacterium]|nr:HAD family hydrolase [Deltaproteobacteria bacterium]
MKASYRAVITDMDGTLYSWVDYIVPALEAMVTSLQQTTGLPRIRIVQSLKEVYERYDTNEYAFAIQESSIFREYAQDFDSFNSLVITPARKAFSDCRRRFLRPYRGVLPTLRTLRARGVRIVALTDAPRSPAERRLKQLELDGLVDALYSLEGFAVPDLVDPAVKIREQEGYYRSALGLVVELPRTHEKPSPLGIQRILSDFDLAPEEVLMVGDNLKKDVAAAAAAGVQAAWAEYGTYISPEYRERLDTFSAAAVTAKNVAAETDHETYRPGATLSNFRQVLELLERGA